MAVVYYFQFFQMLNFSSLVVFSELKYSFVLSGFLIGSIIIEKSSKSDSRWRWIPKFWGRRFYEPILTICYFTLKLVDY